MHSVTRMKAPFGTALVLSLFLAPPWATAREAPVGRLKTLCEVAKPRTFPKGAPRASDVCMRSLGIHPRNAKDPRDTLATARDFHVTHIVWIYTTDQGFVAKANRLGIRVSVALNTILTDGPGLRTREVGRIQDLDGRLVCAPWMRAWNGVWGCANSPDYARIFLDHAKRCVDAGADSLQVDDPAMNGAAVRWGACYCPHCLAAFRRHLASLKRPELTALGVGDPAAFDYKAYLKAGGRSPKLQSLFRRFQQEATRSFFRAFRAEIDAYAGRRVVVSSNNAGGTWGTPYDLFDFGIAELSAHPSRANAAALRERVLDATRRGRTQLFTMPKPHGRAFQPGDVARTRKAIATAYACGSHMLVPWDIYMGSRPRYFGTPAQYADLYAFVRAHARLFDGHEDAAAVGEGIRDSRFRARAPLAIEGGPDACAFARAVPGEPQAPVVVHLVDWAAKPRPLRLRLVHARFFGSRPIRATLLLPGDRQRPLAGTTADGTTTFPIPALGPWGIVLVEPGK